MLVLAPISGKIASIWGISPKIGTNGGNALLAVDVARCMLQAVVSEWAVQAAEAGMVVVEAVEAASEGSTSCFASSGKTRCTTSDRNTHNIFLS